MDTLRALEERLNISFENESLLEQAITHRSYLNENPDLDIEDNERLEFLGDAVLDFVVGAYLFERYPEINEGELTMLRSALVRTKTLAGFARKLDLGHALRLGYGEDESGGRKRSPILCASFEAVVGAIFLDQGLKLVQPWVEQFIAPAVEEIIATSSHKDSKSEFQIWAQAHHNITPRYQVLHSEGPDHEKVFTVSVLMNEETWGVGRGKSKQEAAQAAAAEALEKVEASNGAYPAESGRRDPM